MTETRLTFQVTDDDTAIALGSGEVAVLATPRLLAWCEAATLEALAGELAPGWTSVGVRVELDHLAPTPVGGTVQVTAEPAGSSTAGRRRAFTVRAVDASSRPVATGTVVRVLVDAERFAAPLR